MVNDYFNIKNMVMNILTSHIQVQSMKFSFLKIYSNITQLQIYNILLVVKISMTYIFINKPEMFNVQMKVEFINTFRILH